MKFVFVYKYSPQINYLFGQTTHNLIFRPIRKQHQISRFRMSIYLFGLTVFDGLLGINGLHCYYYEQAKQIKLGDFKANIKDQVYNGEHMMSSSIRKESFVTRKSDIC